MNAAQVLEQARALGIVLSAGGGKVRYEVPAGSLTPKLRQALAENKAAILDILEAERLAPQRTVQCPDCGHYIQPPPVHHTSGDFRMGRARVSASLASHSEWGIRQERTGNSGNPHERRLVPRVPSVPAQNNDSDIDEMTEDALEHFEERAAIAEYDGELSRTDGERQATERVFEYRLVGWAQYGVWLGQPGDGIAEAEHWCRERFGDRVVDVRPYRPGN